VEPIERSSSSAAPCWPPRPTDQLTAPAGEALACTRAGESGPGVTWPGFDHQRTGHRTWRAFRRGARPSPAEPNRCCGWAHSPGFANLHLLAPERGPRCSVWVAMCLHTISAPPTAPFPCWLIWPPTAWAAHRVQPLTTEPCGGWVLHYRQPAHLVRALRQLCPLTRAAG